MKRYHTFRRHMVSLIVLTLSLWVHRAEAGSAADSIPDVLPGTARLEWDLTPNAMSRKMLEGAHQLVDQQVKESAAGREAHWHRDLSSPEAYLRSIASNRKTFMHMIGVADKTVPMSNYNIGIPDEYPSVFMEKITTDTDAAWVAETATYYVYQVRWPVLNNVHGEGLLLQPKKKAVGNIIALPDADQTPEQLVGLSAGVDPESQFARRLAENGYQVLIPVLISRDPVFPEEAKQQQTYREWIYRQAFHMGKHVIGYEVQKVLSAVDWFKKSTPALKIGVAGYGEGGLIAMYSAAVDERIDVALVSGYYGSVEKVWEEPIYRNVWGLLTEFGDAEIATLIAPRPLVIEHSLLSTELEESTRKPDPWNTYSYSGYKGSLHTLDFKDVKTAFMQIDQLLKPGFQQRSLVTGKNNAALRFGSTEALEKFTSFLELPSLLPVSEESPTDLRSAFDPEARQKNQVKEIEANVQGLMRDSDQERNKFFLYKVMPELETKQFSTKSYHPYFSPEQFTEKSREYRKYFREEILGKFEEAYLPPNPRTRKVYDKPLWEGYEVVLDVYDSLIAPGVLLLPKDLKAGEKRPVVVCQHGRNGVPQILIEGNTSYYDMAAKLADQGFIVYVPYGLFNGEDRYRWLSRKANSIKKTLFSFIVAQHEQTLNWLGSLPYVDKSRIAFYGKSYGGETAMRVPSVLEGYCLSICSADFGDWTKKVVDTHFKTGFMGTVEWEMPYFNMGSTFSYAEMAYLIFPRPFMVERGRHDLVQPDHWVAYEYAKVSNLYDQFNLKKNTDIEFFNGGHAARNQGTFAFLHEHLNWP